MVSLSLFPQDEEYDVGSRQGSNSLILPSKKSIAKPVETTEQKKKPLSSTRRKKLEKKNLKRANVEDREKLVEELKAHTLTQDQRNKMLSVTGRNKKLHEASASKE